VLLKPLPYAQPDRLVGIWSFNSQLDPDPFTSSPPDFRALRERATSFDDIAAHYSNSANALVAGEPVRLAALRASPNLFAVLGVRTRLKAVPFLRLSNRIHHATASRKLMRGCANRSGGLL